MVSYGKGNYENREPVPPCRVQTQKGMTMTLTYGKPLIYEGKLYSEEDNPEFLRQKEQAFKW